MRKQFAGGAPRTTLNGAINGSTLTLTLASGTGYPTGTNPFVIAIDRGLSTEEKLLCTARSGTSVTVDAAGRGYDATTAVAHGDGAYVEHVIDSVMIDEANAHANDAPAVAHAGSKISNTPAGTVAATTVQAAINELDGDITALDARVDTLEAADSSGVLAVVTYDPASTNTSATNTIADVDATNLDITFTAPASGDVVVTLTGHASAGAGSFSQMAWGLREGSTTIDERAVLGGINTDVGTSVSFVITGLSGSKTYKWAHRRTVGASTMTTDYGGTNGPAIMTVTALP